MASDGSVTIEIKGDAKNLKKELELIRTQLDRTKAQEEMTGTSANNVFKTVAGTLAALGIANEIKNIGSAILDTGISFESAFAGVTKTVDATDEQLATLRTGIRDLAKEMPTSANEIAGVAEAAGQLGIQTDNILGFTKTMVELGDATNLTADEASSSLARLANITGMSQTDFDRLGSTIVDLGNNMATTESEIVAMGMRIAGAGAQVGMSEDQIMSFSAALSSVGIEAEAGGSSFSTLISKMSLATQQGGDELQQFADVAGMTADEFAQAFEEDASGAILAFIQGLGTLDENGGSAIATLDEMELSDIRMRDALLRAAGASDVFTEALEIGSDAWEENTALANEAEQRYETVESKIGILKNTVSDLGISIYDSLREPLVGALDTVDEFVGRLSEGFDTGGFAGMTSAGVEMMHSLADSIRENLPQMIPVAIEALVEFSSNLRSGVGTLVDAGLDVIMAIAQGIIQNIPVFIETIPQIITNIAGIINDNAPKLLETGLNLIIQLAAGLIQAIPTLIANIPEILQAIAAAFMAFQWLSLGKQLITAIKDGVTSLSESIPTKMREIGSKAIERIKSVNWSEVGTNAIRKIVSGIQSLVSNIPNKIHEIGMSALNKFGSINWSSVGKDVISGIISGITSAAWRLLDKMRSLASDALNAVKEKLGIASPSKLFKQEVGRWIPLGIAQGIGNEADSVGDAITDAIPTSGPKITAAVSANVDDLTQKIKETVNAQVLSVSAKLADNAWQGDDSREPQPAPNGGNIYYSPTFNSPKALNRAEIARQTKKDQRRLKALV